MYKLIFHKDVEKDLKKLDQSVLNMFEKKLRHIMKDPKIGIDLGNKQGMNLSGFKKAYFLNKKYRIVYQVQDSKICIYIVSVGKRESMKVYEEAFKRK